jgi:murein DD-endopeptidase MepM/ murein hydrolase activator NlpD
MTDDAMAASGDTSKTRVDALNKQKDGISAAKDARMKALDDIKKAEEDALKHSQDMEKKRLDTGKDATRQYYEDKKASLDAELKARRRTLETELKEIRAGIPRNKAEMTKQIAAMDKAYRDYGVKLTGYGNGWSKIVGDTWRHNMAISGAALKSDINWASIGSEISAGLLKGGFGMTPSQFAAWLNGGDAPKGSVFAPTAAYKRTKKQQEDYDLRHQGRHSGGIIGQGSGSRTGYSGSQKQSEVWINALKGEAMLNRKATDAIGEENINALNKGRLPKNTGPWAPGGMGSSAIGAAMIAGAVKNTMSQVLMGLAVRRMQEMEGTGEFIAKAGSAGKYGGISLSQEQLNNAATIMGVGRSMGASERDLTIAIMTAMQESTLRNLKYGDRDSLGLFQQRPSQGWGTPAQVTNPSYAARKFFESLLRVGDRGHMTLTHAAQAVQRSAYPEAYAKWESMARSVVGGTSILGNADVYTGLGRGINLGQYGTAGAGGSWVMPAAGPITSHYGMRVNPVTGAYRLHAGSDIGAGFGAAIHAAKSGRVVSVQTPQQSGGYGNYTIIDHGNGIRTAYAHQSKVLVAPGQVVSAGQTIGKVGSTGNSTGPHLHFEYMKNGQRLNPNAIIPSLNVGGWAMSDGLARLHKDEPVLTKPLGADLKEGINRFANGDGAQYNLTVDFRGAVVSSDLDVERAVEKVLNKRDSKLGRNRKVGSK